jgi:hypothetical protein
MDETEAANGFGNRFLWVCVRRSKTLPEGGQIHTVDLAAPLQALVHAAEFGRAVGELRRNDEARSLWCALYPRLSAGASGMFGAVTGRAEAQVMRLAGIYATLDQAALITADHLGAAVAVWDYCEASAHYLFGTSTGDSVADAILEALRLNPPGLTRTQLRDYFGRHKSSDQITAALEFLASHSLARWTLEATDGRPTERWFALAGDAPKATEAPKG